MSRSAWLPVPEACSWPAVPASSLCFAPEISLAFYDAVVKGDTAATWPWKRQDQDVIEPGALNFRDGPVMVPTGPGLGVELDRDALARLNEQYERCQIRTRDDTAYMTQTDPLYRRVTPRW
jgi:hypothetical protein